MRIGYARFSTKFSIDDQHRKLMDMGCEKSFSDDDGSGVGLKAMLEYVREGDTIIVVSLDRLARSIQELADLANDLFLRGIELVSLKEGIDTTKAEGKCILKIFMVVGEFEKELISERVRAGIHTARKNGVKLGRRAANNEHKEWAYRMYMEGIYTMKEICEVTGLSRATIYRYIEQKKAEE